MRHRLGILVLLALACLLAAATASGEQVRRGDLRVRFDAGFAPRALPRLEPAPVTVEVEGAIETSDGSRPPALARLELALNSNGRLSSRGLPVCPAAALQSVGTEVALARCRPALVGHGSFRANLETSAAPVPASGRILVFNARRGGRPALLLHLYGTVPVRAGFVLPLTIRHRAGRQLGTVLATDVPVLAGGLGSITRLKLTIGRTYSFRGQRRSYLSASCATFAGFGIAIFPFARGTFSFRDGRRLQTTLTRECRVRDPDRR